MPYSYQWNTSPVQTTAVASGLAAGNYSVIITDGNGCIVNSGATITQPAGTLPDISLGSDYSSNFFPSANSENTIVYNISEIGGNPATGDTLRIILPAGYEVLFDENETTVNVGTNNYVLDNSRWKLLQTNSAFVSIILDPANNSTPGTLYCGESVRISVRLKRISSSRSIFTVSARLRRADGEANLSNNLNSIIFLAE